MSDTPNFRGLEVTVSVYHAALHFVTVEKLKRMGLIRGGPEVIDFNAVEEIVRLGEAAGYPKPTAEQMQSMIDAINVRNNLATENTEGTECENDHEAGNN
jgi:hypothetical protein